MHFYSRSNAAALAKQCRKCAAAIAFLEVDALPEPDWNAALAEWGGTAEPSALTRFELERKQATTTEPAAENGPAAPRRPSTWKFNRVWWSRLAYFAAFTATGVAAGLALGSGELRLLIAPALGFWYCTREWLRFEITETQVVITDLLRVRRFPRAALREVSSYERRWNRRRAPTRYVELEFEGGRTVKLHTGSQQDDVAGAAVVARIEDRGTAG